MKISKDSTGTRLNSSFNYEGSSHDGYESARNKEELGRLEKLGKELGKIEILTHFLFPFRSSLRWPI